MALNLPKRWYGISSSSPHSGHNGSVRIFINVICLLRATWPTYHCTKFECIRTIAGWVVMIYTLKSWMSREGDLNLCAATWTHEQAAFQVTAKHPLTQLCHACFSAVTYVLNPVLPLAAVTTAARPTTTSCVHVRTDVRFKTTRKSSVNFTSTLLTPRSVCLLLNSALC